MDEALWYKDAVIYELHVKAFQDSNADGIGDFKGLLDRIGYFERLGVTALWLLPFYPSPLRDDGYDIADYYSVHPSYGTIDDFRAFLDAAHAAGLRVITELVLNHTSDQNQWFQRARRAAPGSPERDFYVWSDDPERYSQARIIFQDFETSNWTWDPIARAYYWHRFYSHQPDLNFDNPAVHEALFEVIDFWFGMGVDGLRLDAIPYLYEREGTNCENLPETHAYLKKLRAHIDKKFPGRMLLAEANQWPEDAVAYFGEGDECHMEFHFPLMPRLFMALQMEDRFPILDILDQTPAIPANCQWAIFLRNHDELTLEMVTDEERDYMVRMYARDPRARINLGIRRRLAPLLGNSRRRIELINALLFSLPGTPIIYYGDEIGMGDNFFLGDRDGVRTPMQWSPDRNGGFSRANPQQLYLPPIIDPEYHFEAVNVENQERNPFSLFWWMRRLTSLRRELPVLGHGSFRILPSDNPRVLCYVREMGETAFFVIANLSRFSQRAAVDLSDFGGRSVREVFGRNEWPRLSEQPGEFWFTLGPHDFFWLAFEPVSIQSPSRPPAAMLTVAEPLPSRIDDDVIGLLERDLLPVWLPGCRWFGGKDRSIRSVTVVDQIPLQSHGSEAALLLLEINYRDADSELYQLPIALSAQPPAELGYGLIATLSDGSGRNVAIVDGVYDPATRAALLSVAAGVNRHRGASSQLRGERGVALGDPSNETWEFTSVSGAEQSNTAILVGDRWFLKLYRKLSDGTNPDLELTRYLSEQRGFPHVPAFGGAIFITHNQREHAAGMLSAFTPNQGDCWSYTLDSLQRFCDRAEAAGDGVADAATIDEVIGGIFPERVDLLAKRTAQMHLALAGDEPEFAPEAYGTLYQRALYQSLRNSVRRLVESLRARSATLAEPERELAQRLIAGESQLLSFYSALTEKQISAARIRIHGDYHLGQVLNTGKDFVIIDFEGEPRRALSERRIKRSPLVDVAGMLRSFDYAAHTAARGRPESERASLAPWLAAWTSSISRTFVSSYREALGNSQLVPADEAAFQFLLRCFMLDKAVYEVGYELTYRPTWAGIPLAAIAEFTAAPQSGST